MKSRQENDYSHFRNVRVGGDLLESGNGIDLRASAASANPVLAAVGDDSNVGLNVQPKGTGQFNIIATEAGNAALGLWADEGDDNADKWSLRSTASDNDLDFINNTSVVANLSNDGNLATVGFIRSAGPAGIGYTTGAGGAVTQAASKSTGVTLNTAVGQITMHNAALTDATTVSFTVTNSRVAATDVVIVNHGSAGTAASYLVWPDSLASGSFKINVRNISGGSLGEAIVLNFAVIKGVAA